MAENKTLNELTQRNENELEDTDILVIADTTSNPDGTATKVTLEDLSDKIEADIDASKGYLTDAPSDTNQYVRQDGAWAQVQGGTGAVDSVNTQTGVVVLTGDDIDLAGDDSTKIHAAVDTIKATTDIAVTSSDSSITEIVQLTQAEYEALTPQSDTIYVITGGDVTVTANVQGAATNTVNRIVTIDQTAYNNLGGSVDPNTLYVIEDGVTKDSYVGQIDTLTAKTYYIDIQPIADYTIYSVYLNGTDAGGSTGTIDLQIDGVSQDIEGSATSPSGAFDLASDTFPFGGITMPFDPPLTGTAGQRITLVVTGTPNVTDLAYVIEYGV